MARSSSPRTRPATGTDHRAHGQEAEREPAREPGHRPAHRQRLRQRPGRGCDELAVGLRAVARSPASAAATRPLQKTLAMGRPMSWFARGLALGLLAVGAVVGVIAGRVLGDDDRAIP